MRCLTPRCWLRSGCLRTAIARGGTISSGIDGVPVDPRCRQLPFRRVDLESALAVSTRNSIHIYRVLGTEDQGILSEIAWSIRHLLLGPEHGTVAIPRLARCSPALLEGKNYLPAELARCCLFFTGRNFPYGEHRCAPRRRRSSFVRVADREPPAHDRGRFREQLLHRFTSASNAPPVSANSGGESYTTLKRLWSVKVDDLRVGVRAPVRLPVQLRR